MSVDIYQFPKELQKLKKALQPEAFRFIIISHNHFPIVQGLQEYFKQQFPTKKSTSFFAGNKNYQDFSDEFEKLESGFFFINDFQNVLLNKEFYSGLNQRRDKLAKQKIALVCFVPNEKELIRKCIFNIPDFWEFRNLVINFAVEITQPKISAQKVSFSPSLSFKQNLEHLKKKLRNLRNTPTNIPIKINTYFQILLDCRENRNNKSGIRFAKNLIKFVQKYSTKEKEKNIQLAKIYIGIFLIDQRKYFEAISIFKSLAKVKETSTKSTSYNNLSLIYQDLGDLEKALDFQLKAVKIREKVLDENHPSLATSYNNLSLIYQDLGDLEKALDFQLKAVKIREKVLDENHPSLATSYNNLSSIYKALGDLEKALDFQLKDVKISEKVLDENHPSLATSYNNLSLIYKALGDLEKALDFQLKAVKIREKVLDENHPSLATSYNNLSSIYKALGDLEKALDFQLKALKISEKVLNENHPSLATSYNNLSSIYQDLGDLEKALDFQLKDVKIREKVLDENHPDLAISYWNLSTIYFKLNNLQKAISFCQKAVNIFELKLPPEHNYTKSAKDWLAHFKSFLT